ncbi:MAG TPA: BrnT family toxin [Pararhizobium sp.]|nr:BrnT family toxin [Pararhizobium sp.]
MEPAFEWDDDKAEGNYQKHGVDFVDAAQIFAGPTVQAVDNRKDYGEVRIRAIGEHDSQVFVVIYTPRADTIRIISAWKAGKHDRERYYESLAD